MLEPYNAKRRSAYSPDDLWQEFLALQRQLRTDPDTLVGRSTAGDYHFEAVPCTAAGRALLDDAAASNQRTTLGLGTAAVLAADTANTANAVAQRDANGDFAARRVEMAWDARKGTYANGDTTPTVLGISYLVIANSGATTITQFDDGVEGQVIILQFSDANTTVDRTNCFLSGGVNFVSTANDTLTLISDGTQWREVGRGVNA